VSGRRTNLVWKSDLCRQSAGQIGQGLGGYEREAACAVAYRAVDCRVTDGKADVTVTRHLYPEYRDVYTLMSYVPHSLSHGINTYLSNYRYLCTEQLLSCAMPAVVFAGRDDFGSHEQKR